MSFEESRKRPRSPSPPTVQGGNESLKQSRPLSKRARISESPTVQGENESLKQSPPLSIRAQISESASPRSWKRRIENVKYKLKLQRRNHRIRNSASSKSLEHANLDENNSEMLASQEALSISEGPWEGIGEILVEEGIICQTYKAEVHSYIGEYDLLAEESQEEAAMELQEAIRGICLFLGGIY